MADTAGEPGAEPGRLARAQLRIVHFVASCRGCPFNTRSPREAHVHSIAEGHALAVTKNYLMEPPS